MEGNDHGALDTVRTCEQKYPTGFSNRHAGMVRTMLVIKPLFRVPRLAKDFVC
jgi:hypothetical protein